MDAPPLVIDTWREWERARRIARSAPRRLAGKTEEEKKRAWRELMSHLKPALSKKIAADDPRQPRLFDE